MAEKEINKYPRGWFVIGGSDEFETGKVVPAKYFGEDLVIFRGESGNLNVMAAYCPHLGASFAHGGKVEGDSIRCPFHAWKFDSTGKCVEIPYAKIIPKKACVKTYTTKEINGLCFMWHCPEGEAPTFDIPVLKEYGKKGWTKWHLSRREIKTHPKEIVENVADVAHFKVVHHLTECNYFENIYDEHKATQIMRGKGASKRDIETEATYYGPGYQVTRMQSIVASRLVNAHTPIDENSLHLWFGVMIQESDFSDEEMEEINTSLERNGLLNKFKLTKENLAQVHQYLVASTTKGYHEDVAIWEHKLYRETPMLCDGDGPIPKLRRWYKQFYEPRA
jgi:3-ketosteroid 9alpha-monooxygenase subunit A